jgi:hypothetical protein
VNFLLDENLDESIAPVLDTLGRPNGDSFAHIVAHAPRGTLDWDIPKLCRDLDVQTLVTVNVKDFGAKKLYYQALLNSQIHVVVIRPGRMKMFREKQVGIISMQYQATKQHLEAAGGPTLVRVTQGGAEPRTLEELEAEFKEGRRIP